MVMQPKELHEQWAEKLLDEIQDSKTMDEVRKYYQIYGRVFDHDLVQTNSDPLPPPVEEYLARVDTCAITLIQRAGELVEEIQKNWARKNAH